MSSSKHKSMLAYCVVVNLSATSQQYQMRAHAGSNPGWIPFFQPFFTASDILQKVVYTCNAMHFINFYRITIIYYRQNHMIVVSSYCNNLNQNAINKKLK